MKEYFSHDYDSRQDEKVKSLLSKHGMTGYGIYWSIVESLYINANLMRTHYDSIAYDLHTDSELVKSVITEFDLFAFEGEMFYSESIKRRIDERNEKSEKAKNSAYARWNNANAMRTHSDGNAIKEKNSKGNKRKEKKIIYPDIIEVENYFSENGYKKEAAKKFHEYYSCANWTDSKGNKVKNWKQKAQAVWFKEENKQESQKRLILAS